MFAKLQILLLLISTFYYAASQPNDAIKVNPKFITTTIQDLEAKYGKRYKKSEEKAYRKLVLESNKKKINDHNDKGKKESTSFTLGQNEFIDLSPQQFSLRYAGRITSPPGVREFIKDAGNWADLDQNNCACDIESKTKKSQIEMKLAKNQQQYNRVINSHYYFKNQTDNKIYNLVNGPGSSSSSKGNLKKNKNVDTNIKQAAFSSLITTPKYKLSSVLDPSDVLNISDITPPGPPQNLPPPLVPVIFQTNLSNVDWSSKTGPVRNQGLCGACYAFAASNAVEAAYFIFKLDSYNAFSVQQIIDCTIEGINGCNGGIIEWAFFKFKFSGVTYEKVYPYTSGQTGQPSANCSTYYGQNRISNYYALDGTCTHLRTELQRKPVAAALKSKTLQFYQSGIFDNCTIPILDAELDHAVLVVGFHSSYGWKFKNTWGTTWGVNGYGWLTLDENKNCGICKAPVTLRLSLQAS